MATESKKRLALAIHDFLSSSLKDGTVSPDEKESIEVAQSCIADSFGVDPSDSSAMKDALGGQNLLSIYGVFEKLKGKNTVSTAGASSASDARPATPSTATPPGPTTAQKLEAENLKGQGNSAMAKKDFPAAIESYSKALEIVPGNAIYLSNRAAAYSASHQHSLAKLDAEAAVAADPKYTKAWSRLGLACFALGDAKASMEAYQKGIDAEGNGGSEAMKKGYETAKRKVEEGEDAGLGGAVRDTPTGGAPGGMPDLAGLASMLGGGGGGRGGGGGMPDLGGLMSNPMFASMAQNLMSNPQMMQNILSNPRMREMAEGLSGGGEGAGRGAGGGGGGGGMPDLSALMSDPNIAEMARNMMGGAGGAGRGAGNPPP